MEVGGLFQTLATANGKTLSPSVVSRVAGITTVIVPAERWRRRAAVSVVK
jgi:hypothetical protein